MNSQAFLDSFGYIADAPGGVDRLRSLVLDLAVRGRLTNQDPSDEPSTELLKRIAAERDRMVSANEIRKPKSLPPVSADDIPVLPSGWVCVRFGGLFSRMGAGRTPTGGERSYVKEGVLFLRSQNVYNSGLVLQGAACIPEATHEKMSGTKVIGGDILLNITGASIGRTAVVPCPGWTTANVNQHVSVLRPLIRETTEFLHLMMTSPYFQMLIAGSSPGASREGLAIKRMELFPVPLPPIAEQHRIVARFDELMGLCDELEEQQAVRIEARSTLAAATFNRVAEADSADDLRAAVGVFADSIGLQLAPGEGDLAALKRVRQTILDLAVRGRLTRQNPSDEPAVQLVKRIAAERERLVKAKEFRKPAVRLPLEGDGRSFEVPEGWRWSRLGDVCQSRLGKMLDDQKNKGTPRPYLRNSNVQWGRFELGDVKEIRLEDGELAEYSLRDGDLLVVEGGEPGRCAIWDSTIAEGVMVFQKALHRVRPEGGVSPRFVALALRNGVDTGRLQALFTGTTIRHLTGEKLRTVAIPLPPIEEQHRIVERVGELMDLCDDLEQQLVAARALRGDLGNSVAAHAAPLDGGESAA